MMIFIETRAARHLFCDYLCGMWCWEMWCQLRCGNWLPFESQRFVNVNTATLAHVTAPVSKDIRKSLIIYMCGPISYGSGSGTVLFARTLTYTYGCLYSLRHHVPSCFDNEKLQKEFLTLQLTGTDYWYFVT